MINTQSFAIVTVQPRRIAWLIRNNEWERLETIIKYNSAMLGGYYNILIPLLEEDLLSAEYQQFLLDYDPDIIVLAPAMSQTNVKFIFQQFHAFYAVPWEEVGKIASLDPLGGTPHTNATMRSTWTKLTSRSSVPQPLIAVADQLQPEMSKFSLLACGDVEPREPMLDVFDGKVKLDAYGYREAFLSHVLKPGYESRYTMAYLEETEEDYTLIPPPNRFDLKNIVEERHQFPLTGLYPILKSCFSIQNSPTIHGSFIGLTAQYKKNVYGKSLPFPAVIILVSDNFSIEESILFWNLRAMDVCVAWLSLTDLEQNIDEFARWLESDSGGGYYLMMNHFQIGLVSPNQQLQRLNKLVEQLTDEYADSLAKGWLHISALTYPSLISYHHPHQYIKKDHVPALFTKDNITFLPKFPDENLLGTLAVDLEYPDLMTSQGLNFSSIWKTSHARQDHWIQPYRGFNDSSWKMYYCRINRNHYPRFQLHKEAPVEFQVQPIQETASAIFQHANFSKISLSSTARYHTLFINRADNLKQAVSYFTDHPYRSLLETLANNSDKQKPGWIIDHPSKRRVFNHFHLWEMVGTPASAKTEEYYRLADKLPNEILILLERQLLERGFLISCNICTFKSWYPAELVGQGFTCARCFHTQIYQSNPLWLYKLPEVVFQGFNQDMQVPLLALHYMQQQSKYRFDWIPDSDVFWIEKDKEVSRNLDILCLCDGKFYIGEAKSADFIEKEQFAFYQELCQRVAIDGVIFATSQKHWDMKTQTLIDSLRQIFSGEVIVLTGQDLYPTKK